MAWVPRSLADGTLARRLPVWRNLAAGSAVTPHSKWTACCADAVIAGYSREAEAHRIVPAAIAAAGKTAFSCLAVFFFPIIVMAAARDIMSRRRGNRRRHIVVCRHCKYGTVFRHVKSARRLFLWPHKLHRPMPGGRESSVNAPESPIWAKGGQDSFWAKLRSKSLLRRNFVGWGYGTCSPTQEPRWTLVLH